MKVYKEYDCPTKYNNSQSSIFETDLSTAKSSSYQVSLWEHGWTFICSPNLYKGS